MFKEPFKRALTIIAYIHMFEDRIYHLTMVKVDIRRFDTNRWIIPELVYPQSFSFVFIIVFEKNNFEKDQRVKANKEPLKRKLFSFSHGIK